jgi:hypothetical protein
MRASPRDEDEVGAGEKPTFFVRPSDNVYSYFMFVAPTESKKHPGSGCTWDIVMAYILVGMNFFMQSILVWMVYEAIVVDNLSWQNGILKLKGLGLVEEKTTTGCNDGSALCFRDGGNISCAPPSVQLTGRWNELDTNGDGVWTREEVQASKKALQCKYVVNPEEVFDVLIEMLRGRQNIIWLHPDVLSGQKIHYSYFKYIMGDLIMCGYRSQDMCANLMKKGFFDMPLKHGTAPRVGTTIDSALKYCRKLLQPGGICEGLLPSTYTVWKISSEGECGSPAYDKFVYSHPSNGVKKSLLSVDYSARQEYELAQEFWFQVFKSIVLFTWLLLMFVEFKEVQKIMTVVMRYPDAENYGEDAVLMEQDPSDPEDVRYRIQGITSNHRKGMAVLCALRLGITIALVVVGTSYILRTNVYTDLLMNGVTLFFVAEIASVLYNQVLREEIRDQCEDIKPIKVEMYGWEWLNRQPALLDMISVCFLFLVVYVIMLWQMESTVLPVHTALECTCTSSGPGCVEANKFNKPFWDNYWMKTVPDTLTELDKLKATTPAAMFTSLPHAGNLDGTMTAYAQNRELESRVNSLQQDNKKLETRLEGLIKEEEVIMAANPTVKADQYEKKLRPIGTSVAHAVAEKWHQLDKDRKIKKNL